MRLLVSMLFQPRLLSEKFDRDISPVACIIDLSISNRDKNHSYLFLELIVTNLSEFMVQFANTIL